MAVKKGPQQDEHREPKAGGAAAGGAKARDARLVEEQAMLVRVSVALMALLAFAVVCFSGLWRGHSFDSVIRSSLTAMAVGAAAGLAISVVVRIVVTENFRREHPREEDSSRTSPGAAGHEAPAAGGTTEAAESARRPDKAAATWPNR